MVETAAVPARNCEPSSVSTPAAAVLEQQPGHSLVAQHGAVGVRGDWVIDPGAVMEAGRLVVLVAGFVVAAYVVTGVELKYLDEAANRRRAWFIVDDDEDTAASFVNRRWHLPPGWTVSLISSQHPE